MTGPLVPGEPRKATASNPSGDCVQVELQHEGEVAVRHSRGVDNLTLYFTQSEWEAFCTGAKAGEFDLPARS